eukprot:2111604-Rhodomonas_salina.4
MHLQGRQSLCVGKGVPDGNPRAMTIPWPITRFARVGFDLLSLVPQLANVCLDEETAEDVLKKGATHLLLEALRSHGATESVTAAICKALNNLSCTTRLATPRVTCR